VVLEAQDFAQPSQAQEFFMLAVALAVQMLMVLASALAAEAAVAMVAKVQFRQLPELLTQAVEAAGPLKRLLLSRELQVALEL
jgi:hypothetical protein